MQGTSLGKEDLAFIYPQTPQALGELKYGSTTQSLSVQFA